MNKGREQSENNIAINIAETIDHLSRPDLIRLIKESKTAISMVVQFPDDPWTQLLLCIEAGFRSQSSLWAKQYRIIHNLPDSGISVIVQSMVFGNFNGRSGAGTMWTRDRISGENKTTGEFLQVAEGDEYLGTIDSTVQSLKFESIAQDFPAVYSKLFEIKGMVEKEFKNMQQLDFTIENGVVYILNTHDAKKSPAAAVKCAVDMVREAIINERQAIKHLDLKQLEFFVQSMISPSIDLNELNRKFVGKGIPLAPGCIVGTVAYTLADVLELKAIGNKVIYCFDSITEHDKKIFQMVDAIISLIPARDYLASFYIPSLPPTIDKLAKFVKQDPNEVAEDGESKENRQNIKRNEVLTVDATTGRVFKGPLELVNLYNDSDYQTVLSWSRKYKTLKLYGDFGNPMRPAEKVERVNQFFDGVGFSMEMHVNQLYLGLMLGQEENPCLFKELQSTFSRECFEIIMAAEGLPISFRLMDGRSPNSTNAHDMKGSRSLVLYPDLTKLQVESIISAAILATFDKYFKL